MPTSADAQLQSVLEVISLCHPRRVLDVGMGNARYGYLIRDSLDILHKKSEWTVSLTGIEVFENYVTPIHTYVYDHILIGNAVDITSEIPPESFDLAILLDVIEHCTSEDGHRLLSQLTTVAETVIVSTPKVFYKQEAFYGNEHEQHLSFWSADALGAQIVIPNDYQLISVLSRNPQVLRTVRKYVRRVMVKQWTPTPLRRLLVNAYRQLHS